MRKRNGSEVAVQKTMDLTVNGGKPTVDSATVPIQWFFTEAVAEQGPTHILICEQTQHEMDLNGGCLGRRMYVPVSRGIAYLQIREPGLHRVAVLAFAGNGAEEAAELYLKKGSSQYNFSLEWTQLKNGVCPSEYCVAACVVEFTVPESEFAEKPAGRLGNLAWKWANFFHKNPPCDECEFRKRLWFYTWPKLFVLLGWLVYRLTIGIFCSVYATIGSGLVLFSGFRPKPYLENIQAAWTHYNDFQFDLVRFGSPNCNYWDSRYRLWDVKQTGQHSWEVDYVWMTFAPWEVILTAGLFLGWLGLMVHLGGTHLILIIAAFVVVTAVLAGVAYWFLLRLTRTAFWDGLVGKFLNLISSKSEATYKEWQQGRQDRRRQAHLQTVEAHEVAKKKIQATYGLWLKSHMTLPQKPASVDLSQLPVPFYWGERILQWGYVRFWEKKKTVCRPYPRH